MVTRRVRRCGSVARIVLLGALALTVLFAAAELDTITANPRPTDPHHAVILSRDSKANVTAATSTRARGTAWVAALCSALGGAALAAQLLDTRRRATFRRNLQRFSIRLRGPPRVHVAH